MNSLFRKTTAVALTAALGTAALGGCGSQTAKDAIDGTKTVATINGEELPLGVLSFFAKYQQAWYTQIYMMYMGTSEIFDTVQDEATGETYGESMRGELLDELESLVVMRQHLSDYGLSVSDEQKAQIEAAAQAYIDKNDEEVRARIGASKEDVMELMELQTAKSLLLDPIAEDVDTKVEYGDIQQTSVTYVQVPVPDALPAESGAESAAEAVLSGAEATVSTEAADSGSLAEDSYEASSVSASSPETVSTGSVTASGTEAAAESTAAEAAQSVPAAAESIAENIYEEPAPELQAYAEERAQRILDALMAEDDPNTADMDAAAKSVDETLYVQTGQFTTNNPMDATVDFNVTEACAGLPDHTLVDHVIKSEDGTAYYVARVELVNDEELSKAKEEETIVERKRAHFTEVTDEWKDSSEIKVDEDVLNKLVLTDSAPFILKAPEETESGAESSVTGAEPMEEETESTVLSDVTEPVASVSAAEAAAPAAEAVISTAENAASAAEAVVSAAEAVISTAENAASTAEKAVK